MTALSLMSRTSVGGQLRAAVAGGHRDAAFGVRHVWGSGTAPGE